ncbi:MAG: methyltransferase domain-containing protein [Patescibacteria group bacterium]
MHFITYIIPKTILKTGSFYNRDIRVVEEALTYKLLVNGATETGPYIRKLLLYAFKKFNISKEKNVNNILVLGVAGGAIIHMLHDMYPKAYITGVDIDAVMIEIGNKYFELSSIKKLKLVVEDAKDYVKNCKTIYDCVVIDLFIGRDIPAFVSKIYFLRRVKKLLSSSGFVFINYLKELEYPKALEKEYNSVVHYDKDYNRFFLAKKNL